MSASELKQFYLDKGAELFEKLPFFKFVKRLLYWTYSKENLEKELKDVFGETKLFEIDRLLSIQTKDTRTRSRSGARLPHVLSCHGDYGIRMRHGTPRNRGPIRDRGGADRRTSVLPRSVCSILLCSAEGGSRAVPN